MSRRKRKGRRGLSPVSLGQISISSKGYGFVDTPEGEYFVLRSYLRGAMDGDTVEVVRLRSLEARRKQEPSYSTTHHPHPGSAQKSRGMLGCVRRVVERSHKTVVGRLHRTQGLRVVVPLDDRINYDFFLDPQAHTGLSARDGDLVVLRITGYPSRHEAALGYIEEVLGHEDDQNVGIEVIIREHGIETGFSDAALKEAERLVPLTLEKTGAALLRRDLRNRCVFTIDPSDAKDYDDALSLDYVHGVMRLGVHIADVSAYVDWDSAIDLDARRRATSVYLPDRVIPMLPSQLSENLCSLRPGEDRAALTIDMFVDKDGRVTSSEFYPSMIFSSAAMSYDEVLRLIDNSGKTVQEACDPEILSRLQSLKKLTQKLYQKRLQQGAIDFESVEAKLILGEKKQPEQVILRTKTDATAIVEEAMILANEQVASYMLKLKQPMVYRIHEKPYPERLDELIGILQEFGYTNQGAPQSSHEIQAILEENRDKPEYHLISSLLLRAMKRARYATFFSTHFGLASSAYTHFTSPIRRYPDLMAHRLLKHQMNGEEPSESMRGQLNWICEHATEKEYEAERASSEATTLKLCEFLLPRVGETFMGTVVSLNSAGLFVREDTTTAEGFVSRENLPRGCVYDADRHRYHNPYTEDSFRLGQRLMVKLKTVDTRRAKLHFVIA